MKKRKLLQIFIVTGLIMVMVAALVFLCLKSLKKAGNEKTRQEDGSEAAMMSDDAPRTDEAEAEDADSVLDIDGERGGGRSEDKTDEMPVIRTDVEDAESADEELIKERVRAIIDGMDTGQKLYQLFVVTPEQLTGADRVTAASQTTLEMLAKRPVGGIIYFADNLTDPEQTREMLGNTDKYAMLTEGMPLFLCVDEEGGRIARIAGNPAFNITNMESTSKTGDANEAHERGLAIGGYLRRLGFNTDFAPDVDVLTNAANTVIGDRSFGSDPLIVSQFGKAFSDGLHENGILSTYKHFPGHGATTGDTHDGYAYTDKTYEDMKDCELLPFAAAQESGIDMVMAAHISVPDITGDDTPCSMSREMITGILRENLGYNGLIITDALNMGAVSQQYDSAQAAVCAISAGVDLLLMPSDLDKAYEGLKDALDEGKITQERIDESLERIISAKLRLEDVQTEEDNHVVLGDERFEDYMPMLEGKRVALLSNQTGIVGDKTDVKEAGKRSGYDLIPFGYDAEGNEITYGQHILDALIERGVNVTAVFSPEHGFRGTADAGAGVDDSVDEKTGVPILSLYHNNTHSPSRESMDVFDTLVIDMQDVGLRYYTYYISMYYMMDACAAAGKEVIILDRPNPNGFYVDGPVLKEEFRSNVGQLPIPVVYGMTWGELAGMINGEGWLEAGKDACDLKVIPCLGYTHNMKTDLICRPSPNIKDMRAVYLYASTCFFENTYVSVGRGTEMPFEIYGSPYLDPERFAYSFMPKSMEGALDPPFGGRTCYGESLRDIPLDEIFEKGINLDYLTEAYNSFHEDHPDMDFFAGNKKGKHYWIDLLSGSDDLRKQIIEGKSPQQIKASWSKEIEEFKIKRKPYLLYEE